MQHMTTQAPELTLLDMSFPDYNAGKEAGPFNVVVTDGVATKTLSVDVGFCENNAPCAGPISLEYLELAPSYPGFVIYFQCVGLDGTKRGGIETSGTGDCD